MTQNKRFYILNTSDKTKEKINELNLAFYRKAVDVFIQNEDVNIDSNEDLLECMYLTIEDIIS